MRSWNFSLATLLAVVTLLCFDLAAVVADARLAASAAYTAFVGLLCFAAAVALAAPANLKPFWIGFAVFGLVYWVSAFDAPQPAVASRTWAMSGLGLYSSSPYEPPAASFVSNGILDLIEANLAPRYSVGSHVFARWRGGGYYWGTIIEVDGGQYVIKWDDGSTPTPQTAADIAGGSGSRRVALHATAGTLWALLGGAIVAFWLTRQAKKEKSNCLSTPEQG